MTHGCASLIRLVRRLRECWPLFAASTGAVALGQLTLVAVSATSVWITTRFYADASARLTGLFAGLFALIVAHGVASLLDVWWSHEVAYRILHTLRVHLYAAIVRIAPVGLHGRRTADVASAAMSDAEQLEWFYAHTAATAICAVFSPAVVLAILTRLIGPIALVMLVPLVTMVALAAALVPLQRRQGAALRAGLVDLRTAVLESVQGQRELRSLGMVAAQHDVIDGLTAKVQRILNRQALRKACEGAYAVIASAAGSTLLLVVLTGRVVDDRLDGALLPVAVVLAGMCAQPTAQLVGMIGRIGEIGACAARIDELLDAPDPIPADPVPRERRADEDGELAASRVAFAYERAAVLTDVSLRVTPRRSLALVGASGAGKTTFANLAMRFLDPDSGAMRFDGLDLTGYAPESYRSRLALIPQDCHLFAGTLRTNLALARPDATDAAMWQALEQAHIADLARRLGGLDAPVGERGATFSGGERQRLGIARALLRDPDLLILDEPLANIDPLLESQIAANLRTLRADRATIVIAHRLASMRIADHMVVLEGGRVAAQGTHEDLLDDARYRALLGHQIEDG